MNSKETAVLLAIAWEQWPHMKPSGTIAETWRVHLADFDFGVARDALTQLLGESKWPPTIGHLLDVLDDDHCETVMQMVATGAFRHRLEASNFPDKRSYDAAMAARHVFYDTAGGGTPDQCRKAYKAAWRDLPRDTGRPELAENAGATIEVAEGPLKHPMRFVAYDWDEE